MALALRLFLPLLLAVALPARAAQAAPLQVRGADEHARKASPAAWFHADFQPLKPPAGVSAGKTFQAPFRVAAHKPSSHRREMDREDVLKAEFPGGSSGSLAASAAGREAMPGTVTGGWDRDLHHLERLANHGLRVLELGEAERDDEDDLDSQPIPITEPQGDAEGVSAGRTFPGPLVDVAHKLDSHRRGPLRRKNKPTGDSKSLEESKHLEQILSDVERHGGGCISLSLPLGLSSRGLSLHIWTRRAQHRGKGSMAAWLPRCCFHGLQGCFPAWPGCSFSPASAGRHLAAADREPKLHHGPEIPCNFLVSGLMQRGSCLQEGGPWSSSKTLAIFLVFIHPLTSIAWSRTAQHRGIMACRLRGLGTGQSCAKGRQGPSSGGNRDQGPPVPLHRAASSAVEHSTGSRSPLLPQMQPAPQHMLTRPGKA
ncbi:uncharacterized protein LOC128802317 isoform X1 [Vidua chalybeata]|uniref:uncharacterized protein LOC128802317 isoform X1 n=1 Tax=Vidua chalybeata TaxID=81927 RepID=UPI0023A8F912|nr:uncharacterized protein LOC128802317 isoform X1 [Vidua chalybeata]